MLKGEIPEALVFEVAEFPSSGKFLRIPFDLLPWKVKSKHTQTVFSRCFSPLTGKTCQKSSSKPFPKTKVPRKKETQNFQKHSFPPNQPLKPHKNHQKPNPPKPHKEPKFPSPKNQPPNHQAKHLPGRPAAPSSSRPSVDCGSSDEASCGNVRRSAAFRGFRGSRCLRLRLGIHNLR